MGMKKQANQAQVIDYKDFYNEIENLVIVILGDKGGIGKTLLGYNLTFRTLRDEPSCQLIDCDNDQYSSADFAALRKSAGIQPEMPVINIPTKDLEGYLLKSSKNIKINFIEFGKSFGEDEKSRIKALELAIKLGDIVLYPMPASPVDAIATGKWEKKLPEQIMKIPAILIPNKVRNKSRLKMVMDAAPDLKYFKVSKTFLGDRLCYQDSFLDNGKSIFEIRPKSDSEYEAINEFENLYREIINILIKFYGK